MPFFDRPWALLLVLAIILIIWGPGKLPEVGSAIGRAMREFRRSSSELTDEIRKSAAAPPQDQPGSTATTTEIKPPADTKA